MTFFFVNIKHWTQEAFPVLDAFKHIARITVIVMTKQHHGCECVLLPQWCQSGEPSSEYDQPASSDLSISRAENPAQQNI